MSGINPFGVPLVPTDDLKAYLQAGIILPPYSIEDALVYRTGDRQLKTTYGKRKNTVYILKQNVQSTGPGGSSGPTTRQTYDVFVNLSCVAGKFDDGVVDSEEDRNRLVGAVYGLLHGKTIANMDFAFDLASYTDGDPADTVNYGILRFHTRKLTQRTMS